MTHWTCENHLIVPWSTRQSTWYLRVWAAWRCLLLIGTLIWIIWLTESNSFDMNLICLHFWWVAYLPGRPWFNAWFNICGNSQSCFQKCAKFALEKISYLCGCWLLPLPLLLFLHLQRLLGTGMQSICKFSLLCRVCKCSSIWLLSIFPCWLPVTPSPLCHLRVFCVISTLERIERCLLSVRPIVYTLPGGPCLALFLLYPAPLGYANDAWLPLGSWMDAGSSVPLPLPAFFLMLHSPVSVSVSVSVSGSCFGQRCWIWQMAL